MSYRNKRVLVTGGLGFIGSNLAIRAVELGAQVTIVDSEAPGCGANVRNIASIRKDVELIREDIGYPHNFAHALSTSEVIFNLAGEISHCHSMLFPERDLELNVLSQLRFVNACRDLAPDARIVYAGTRQIYGVPKYLPVDEAHPISPVDFNGVHKFAALMYHLMIGREHRGDVRVLQLSNVYGPRMALNVPCQGFLSTYVRRMVLGQSLEIWGDGTQLRDPVYVDNVVDVTLLAGESPTSERCTYNIGGSEALSISQIADTCAAVAGGLTVIIRPFPTAQKAIDIGSYCTDYRLAERDLGWRPTLRFADGIKRTLEYYCGEKEFYINDEDAAPTCPLPHEQEAKRHLVMVG